MEYRDSFASYQENINSLHTAVTLHWHNKITPRGTEGTQGMTKNTNHLNKYEDFWERK